MIKIRRRDFLKKTILLLGGTTLAPLVSATDCQAWGAIENVLPDESNIVPTHQLIVQQAVGLLNNLPIIRQNPFPSSAEIQKNDYVKISLRTGQFGTGPDVPGKSNFSDHYYNPRIREGNGPTAVKKYFIRILQNKFGGTEMAKNAAWAAHFISDMNVPYHVSGMTRESAAHALRSDKGFLTLDASGPHELYFVDPWSEYIRDNMGWLLDSDKFAIPKGWGKDRKFESALQEFFRHSSSSKSDVDWFDPWYFNGYNHSYVPEKIPMNVITGSHGAWEANAHRIWFKASPQSVWNELVNEQKGMFDSKWKNGQVDFNQPRWEPQGSAAKEYAKAVALHTRNNLIPLWEKPQYGICRSIMSVLTLYRASMTALTFDIQTFSTDRDKFGINFEIRNTESNSPVKNVSVNLNQKTENNKWVSIRRIHIGEISPNQTYRDRFLGVQIKFGDTEQFAAEVSGIYPFVPDLGYNRRFFNIKNNNLVPENDHPDPPEPNPVKRNQKPPIVGKWSMNLTVTSRAGKPHRKMGHSVDRTIMVETATINSKRHLRIIPDILGLRHGGFMMPVTFADSLSTSYKWDIKERFNLLKREIRLSFLNGRLTGSLIDKGYYYNNGNLKFTEHYQINGRKIK